jgi:hypothetical protein
LNDALPTFVVLHWQFENERKFNERIKTSGWVRQEHINLSFGIFAFIFIVEVEESVLTLNSFQMNEKLFVYIEKLTPTELGSVFSQLMLAALIITFAPPPHG